MIRFCGVDSTVLRNGACVERIFTGDVLAAPPDASTEHAIYFFEMSVLFETGELNAYVYDGGGLYRLKYV